MNATGNLNEFVSAFVSLTDFEYTFFESLFEKRYFKKKEKLLNEGEVEKYLNFIESGLARLYFVSDKEETVMQFSAEHEVICCFESYLSEKPSKFFVDAIEDLEVLSVTLENLEKAFSFSPKFERLGRLFATQEYLKKTESEYYRVRVTTKQRFIDFIRNNQKLVQRVPQKYLASFLDIKPETFSRMKHLTKGRL